MASDMDGDGMIDFDEWCSMMSFMYLSESDEANESESLI